MNLSQVFYPLLGGSLIGVSATIMLIFVGRVAGISGIIASSLAKPARDGVWRWMFLCGLVAGGVLVHSIQPGLFSNTSNRSLFTVFISGLLVGYGTVMGSGCTSGHGVCGISRLSVRSLVATLTFMLFGVLAVQAKYLLRGSM